MELLGVAFTISIIIAMLLIYIGIRKYRDEENKKVMDNIEKTNDALPYNPKSHLDHSSIQQDWKNEMPVCFLFLFSHILLFHIF